MHFHWDVSSSEVEQGGEGGGLIVAGPKEG